MCGGFGTVFESGVISGLVRLSPNLVSESGLEFFSFFLQWISTPL